MLEPDMSMDQSSTQIIHQLSRMVGSAAKEDQPAISIPMDQIQYLIHSIKYAYATGAIAGAMNRKLIDDCIEYCNFFNQTYPEINSNESPLA